ncbi:tail fiber domain-containing protein [Dyadobacter fermentans]|uniref:tail fiber domain-containing protein n=1 Tax=Dyadobacter fermentans TaxID=94254 RepID=UPI001CC0DC5C|nr:tail fiber domain-containing protein [Dyadobacter fermentans]MBZ1360084.1 tail fiber domain-containing protein [Dyadobacter fermentans]
MKIRLLQTKKLCTAAVIFGLTWLASPLFAQVKVGDNPTTINANSMLEVESTSKGLLLPRLPLTQTTNPAPLNAHVAGMTVYNTATANDVVPGFYYNDGTKWVATAGETNYTYTFGGGAPTGSCTDGQLYTDTLETSPTFGQQYVCNGGSWVSYVAPNRTAWYLRNTTNDAGGNKVAWIYRTGYVEARNNDGLKHTRITPDGGIKLFRDPGANAGVTNGYIDFSNSTSDTYPMRIAMRSDAALGDLAFTIQDHSGVRMAVTQAGLVGIGTGVTAPNSRLQVAGITRVTPAGALTGSMILGTSNEDGVELNPAGTLAVQRSSVGANLYLTKVIGGGDALNWQIFNRSGNTIGSISSPANNVNSVQYNTTSDIRLKENIGKTRYGLADLLKIRVADYNYKIDEKKNRLTGFLAQDLYKIFPNAVTVGGKDPKTEPWLVDYGKVTPLIVKAVQEQQALIEQLQAQVAELKSKNASLTAELSGKTLSREEVASLRSLLKNASGNNASSTAIGK